MKEKDTEDKKEEREGGRHEEWGHAEQASFALHLPLLERPRGDASGQTKEPRSGSKGEEVAEEKQIPLIETLEQEELGEEEASVEEEEVLPLEAIFEDIEEIVNHLETEEVSLEESLRLFEQGIRHCRLASRRLDEAERVMERLMKDPETGAESVKPWDETK